MELNMKFLDKKNKSYMIYMTDFLKEALKLRLIEKA